jgi:hypothetical protein
VWQKIKFLGMFLNDWPARDIQMWEYVQYHSAHSTRRTLEHTIGPLVILTDVLQPFAALERGGTLKRPIYLSYLPKIHYKLTTKGGTSLQSQCVL